jgi:predicted HTH transcriptional regulator
MRFDPTLIILLVLFVAAAALELFSRRRNRKRIASAPTIPKPPTPIIATQETEDMAKQPPKALTQRAWEALKEHGPQTTDALASKLRTPSRAVGKALSQLKKRGLSTFRRSKSGENVHSAKGKTWPAK